MNVSYPSGFHFLPHCGSFENRYSLEKWDGGHMKEAGGRSLGTGTAFSASEDYAVESLSVALSLCSDSFPAHSGARPLSAWPAKRDTNQLPCLNVCGKENSHLSDVQGCRLAFPLLPKDWMKYDIWSSGLWCDDLLGNSGHLCLWLRRPNEVGGSLPVFWNAQKKGYK